MKQMTLAALAAITMALATPGAALSGSEDVVVESPAGISHERMTDRHFQQIFYLIFVKLQIVQI